MTGRPAVLTRSERQKYRGGVDSPVGGLIGYTGGADGEKCQYMVRETSPGCERRREMCA